MGEETAPEERPNKLPVIATARETYAVILRNPGAFLAAAALPFAIYVLIGAMYRYVLGSGLWDYLLTQGYRTPDRLTLEILVRIADEFLTLLAITTLGLGWHCFVLLESRKPRFRDAAFRHWRRWRYFFWALVVTCLASFAVGAVNRFATDAARAIFVGDAPSDALNFYVAMGVNLLVLALCALWVRICLVLPVVAVSQEPYGLRASWRDTSGLTIRFFFILLLLYIPFSGFMSLVSYAYHSVFWAQPYLIYPSDLAIFAGFAHIALHNTLFMGIVISLLSVLFLELKGRELALAELAEDQSRPSLGSRLRAAVVCARYWRPPD
ncbi:MAG: hypothetical protein WD489_08420 [Rhodovibrionaceae bacterium]